jgi:hypothetical protein
MKLPSNIFMSDKELTDKFRHRVVLMKGGHVIAKGMSSLGGCRYLNATFGRSCHAEVNACKMLSNETLSNKRKVEKNRCI